MEKTEKINIDKLLTAKTKSLFELLATKYTIEVERVLEGTGADDVNCKRWECHINDNDVKIKTYDKENTVEYFTHELLHVKLDLDGFATTTTIYQDLIRNTQFAQYLLTPHDIGHINNTIAHYKMLPDFLEFGFEENMFLSDYDKIVGIENTIDEISNKFPKKGIPNEGKTKFICHFFSHKFNLNRELQNSSNFFLSFLKEFNSELFTICDKHAKAWINSKHTSENYAMFQEMIDEFENWLRQR